MAAECLRYSTGSMEPFNIPSHNKTRHNNVNHSGPRISFSVKEPIGPVVAISAFNHPLNLIVHQIVPAIAAGCPVIVKAAPETPLSCHKFVQLLKEAGLPENWCFEVVTDDVELAQVLATDHRAAFFSFIGSASVGWHLRSQLSPGTRCSLEHGGAAPVIVVDNFDQEATVEALLKGGFYHAGQVCISVQRVFAPDTRALELAEALAAGANQLKVGDPLQADTDVGPMIRNTDLSRIHAWITEAQIEGAKILCGGQSLQNNEKSSNLYAPTVLFDPSDTSKVSTREIFGPVICVYPYSDIRHAINRANAIPFAFHGAVFGKDLSTCLSIANELDASAVMINDHTAFRTDGMPFAGLKQSGLGVGGIPHTLADMQVNKLIVMSPIARYELTS